MLVINKKGYTSPEVNLSSLDACDVITASNGGDNLGGIPDGWSGVSMQGGDFE